MPHKGVASQRAVNMRRFMWFLAVAGLVGVWVSAGYSIATFNKHADGSFDMNQEGQLVANGTSTVPQTAAPSSAAGAVSDAVAHLHCPSPFSRAVRYGDPASAADMSMDKSVAEFELVAEPAFIDILGDGKAVEFMTFNGEYPGPQLNVRLGQRVVVHFYNHLAANLSIHWHGIETPATSDGSLTAQLPTQPGEYRRYEFVPHAAGLTWYHPHFDTHEVVHRGLHGTMLVRSPHEDKRLDTMPNSGGVMVLTDLNLAATPDHPIVTGWPTDPEKRAEQTLNGLVGDVLLSNGHPNGEHTIWRQYSDKFPMRLRIVNVANARFMRVFVPGMKMWRVGGDQGLISHPIMIHPVATGTGGGHGGMAMGGSSEGGLVITPGERADIVLTPDPHMADMSEYHVMWYDLATGRHSAVKNADGSWTLAHAHNDGQRLPRMLAKIKMCGTPAPLKGGDWMPPANLRAPSPINPSLVETTIDVTFGHMPPMANGMVMYFAMRIGGMPRPYSRITAAEAPRVNVGSVHRVRVINLTAMKHNFHLHGFDFQWAETRAYHASGAVETTYPHGGEISEDKDTIIVAERPGAMGVTRTESDYLVDFSAGLRSVADTVADGRYATNTTSGGWVMHCHILEHADAGMMSLIQVV